MWILAYLCISDNEENSQKLKKNPVRKTVFSSSVNGVKGTLAYREWIASNGITSMIP